MMVQRQGSVDSHDSARSLPYSTESLRITIPERIKENVRTYRSTYDFSSPRRYKSVIHLEPRLAPVKYWRKINFGTRPDLKHKSGVDCAFRPRPNNFSETAWIFPKQARDVVTSRLATQLLVDTRWYKSLINRDGFTEYMDEETNSDSRSDEMNNNYPIKSKRITDSLSSADSLSSNED